MKKKVFCLFLFMILFTLCGCSDLKNIKFINGLKIGTYNGKRRVVSYDFKKNNDVDITDDLNVDMINGGVFDGSNHKNNTSPSYTGAESSNLFVINNFTLSKTVNNVENAFKNIIIDNFYYDGTLEDYLNINQSFGRPIFKFCNNIYFLDENGNVNHNDKKYKLTKNAIVPMNFNDKVEALAYNQNINKVIIESGITTIGEKAFYECTELECITIPNTVTILKSKSLWTFSGLFTLYYCGSEDDWEKIDICDNQGHNARFNLFFYSEEKPDYKANQYWHYVNGNETIWD